MKPKIGDTIKIDIKKLTEMKNTAVLLYFVNTITKKLNLSKNQTLYVAGITRDGKRLNVRSWSNDKTGDLTIPRLVVKSIMVEGKLVDVKKSSLNLMIKKQPPTNIKPGDYVELLGRDVMGMIDGGALIKAIKKVMNVMYVQSVKGGMITVTPYKFNTNKEEVFEVPLNFVRWKLANVLLD